MFPGAGAVVYRNEMGEPLGWDYPSDEPADLYLDDPYEWSRRESARQMDLDDAFGEGISDADDGKPHNRQWAEAAYGRTAPEFVADAQAAYDQGYEEAS